MPLRATVHIFWIRDWSFFGLRIGLLSGPWYVLMMSLQCRTRRAGQKSSKCSGVFAKLLHWRVLVKKEEPWQKRGTSSSHRTNCSRDQEPFPEDPEPPALVPAPISALLVCRC